MTVFWYHYLGWACAIVLAASGWAAAAVIGFRASWPRRQKAAARALVGYAFCLKVGRRTATGETEWLFSWGKVKDIFGKQTRDDDREKLWARIDWDDGTCGEYFIDDAEVVGTTIYRTIPPGERK